MHPKQKVSTPVSAEVMTHSEKSAGSEQECLGDLNNNMSIDEEVDMNIDPLLREPRLIPQAGPSRSVLPSAPPSASIIPSCSPPTSVDLAETFTSFSSFISNTADQGRPTNNSSSSTNAEDPSSDPALQIDRLTGISPPLKRAPRAQKKKTVTTAPLVMSSATGSKATTKGKQKQKEAVIDLGEDENGMDTDEGS